MAQFFINLNNEKSERLKLHATIRQLGDELAQLRRQVNEPSSPPLPVPFRVNPLISAAFQDYIALDNIQISRPKLITTLERTSSTTPQPRLTELPRAPPSTQTTSGPFSDLETRVKQLEEEINQAKNSRKTIASIYRSQFAFPYDRIRALQSGGTDTNLWKLLSLTLVFDAAKSSARLNDAAKDPSTHYNSPVYRTHPLGYNYFVKFYPYGMDSAAGNHASIVFALFPGDYDGLLAWPFPKTIHLSVRDQLDPLKKWTRTSEPSEKVSFRRPTR